MSETVIRPSDHPAAQDDPDQHRDHGHDEKEVNEPARHVEHGEAEQPQHEEDDGDAPQETQFSMLSPSFSASSRIKGAR